MVAKQASLDEVIFDMSFLMGAMWKRISEDDGGALMDVLNGSTGLFLWVREQAAEFEKLWLDPRSLLDKENYNGEVDSFFTRKFESMLAENGITMRGLKDLPEDDYVLTDKAAWFTVGNISVRICGQNNASNQDGVTVRLYANQCEDYDEITGCYASHDDANEIIEENMADGGPF